MARRIINLGSGPNTKTGDSARSGGDKINLNFEEVYTALEVLSRVDIIIENRGSSLVGDDLTVNEDWEWMINNSLYTNPLPVLFEDIALSSSGKTRLVYVVPNNENAFDMIDGDEVVSDPQPPYLPNGGMYVTFFEVSDTEIGVLNASYDGESLGNKLDRGGYLGTAQDIVDQAESGDATTLASANAYTDAKVSGAYIYKGNKTNYADLVATGEHVNGYVYNLSDTDKNYAWNGSAWDDIGGTFDISGKEDVSNKKTVIAGNEASDSFYGSIKSWITYFKEGFIGLLPAKGTALVDGDLLVIGDSEDVFKTKTRTFAQLKANLLTWLNGLFQAKDDQIEISANSNVLNAWHGQTILFTANCTITVPAALNNSLMFPFKTLTGVTVTWAITSPFTWETTPSATPEKTTGHFMRRGSTNTIMLDV